MGDKYTAEQKQELLIGAKKAFDEFDDDKSGFMDPNEIEDLLVQFNASPFCKNRIGPEKIREVSAIFLTTADKNGDGKVSFEEFYKYLLDALGCKE